ncbi:MAG: NUDIX hydrolase [Candidatus Omnitrophica bacterium]|nr:NUDIX hydrolase [Candidatus Omnitrophota bacterium]
MVLVLEDKKTFLLFEKHVYGYIRHVQEDLGCGPYPTVDMIIDYKGGIVVIERTNPPYGFALPGGFVDNGETLEHAAQRESKEETNLELENLQQFHTYSDPRRDPRFQTISTVFTAKGKGVLRFGDDAKGAQVISYEKILDYDFAFDHKEIICDYLKGQRKL